MLKYIFYIGIILMSSCKKESIKIISDLYNKKIIFSDILNMIHNIMYLKLSYIPMKQDVLTANFNYRHGKISLKKCLLT